MKLKNKLLIILLLFIGLLFLCSNKTFANSDYTYNDITISLPDIPERVLSDYPYYIIFPESSTSTVTSDSFNVVLVACSEPIVLHDYISDYSCYRFYNQPFIKYSCGTSGRVAHPGIWNYIGSATNTYSSVNTNIYVGVFDWSNHNIYHNDELVFRQAGGSSSGESGGGDTGNGNSGNTGSESSNTTNSTVSESNTTGSNNNTSNTSSGVSDFEEDSTSGGILAGLGNILRTVFEGFFEGITYPLGVILRAIGDILTGIFNLVDYLLPNPLEDDDSWIVTDFIRLLGILLQPIFNLVDYLIPNPLEDNDKWIVTDFIQLLGNLLRTLFIPQDGWFDNQVNLIKGDLNNHFHFSQYLEDIQSIQGYANSYDSDSPVDTYVNLPEYRIADGLSVSMPRFVDFSIIGNNRDIWFNWIRVLTYPLIIFFNINSVSKLFLGHSIADGNSRDSKGKGEDNS